MPSQGKRPEGPERIVLGVVNGRIPLHPYSGDYKPVEYTRSDLHSSDRELLREAKNSLDLLATVARQADAGQRKLNPLTIIEEVEPLRDRIAALTTPKIGQSAENLPADLQDEPGAPIAEGRECECGTEWVEDSDCPECPECGKPGRALTTPKTEED